MRAPDDPPRDGKRRALGLPSFSDKLLAEVIRMLLNAYYDVQFSDRSHGFRPDRGCHTALGEVVDVWNGTHWFIEGDIAQCFDSLDHQVMLKTMGEKILDNRFLRLIGGMLKAGYLEDWRWNATLSGVPQGGIASPIMSNIYLDRLDKFVETQLIPQYHRGQRRRENPDYEQMSRAIRTARKREDREAARALRRQRRLVPSKDLHDPGYRRLRYCRYADDILLGFSGPKSEAVQIKQQLGQFLQDELKLKLSESKTLITHAHTGRARFLDTTSSPGIATTSSTPGDGAQPTPTSGYWFPAMWLRVNVPCICAEASPGIGRRCSATMITRSCRSIRPSIGASSSTTCWRAMFTTWTNCIGSCRPRC
jgi:group II intron reverse transcriptase/maturase